ncbi:acyl-CoA dehydrogenase IpdE2-like [Ylistrum balloti]|uniref:acyl-CoA dehydrogenase IpdE2-like n=1 Tax=Ylistrum balloti TaxID=509963 RepID=UPI0029058144|nr:acyl-CoA dehydrogenase IpdE2-like [Ylistrum balloti]
MNTILTTEQKLLVETITKIVQEQVDIEALRRYRDDRSLPGYDPKLWQQLAELGFLGLAIPETYGGADLSFFEVCLLLEATGSKLMPEPLLSTTILATELLKMAGNKTLCQEFLPKLATGNLIITLAHQEQESHYNRYHIEATAKREGDTYTLNGRKTHVLDGHISDTYIMLFRTGGQTQDRDGLTLFLVPKDQTGLKVTRQHQIDGRNTAIIECTNIIVKESARLGSENEAATLLDPIFDLATIALSAEMLGAAQAAFDLTLDYLKERQQFDQPIGAFQALQHRAARLFVDLSLARSAVLTAAAAAGNKNQDLALFASLAKAKMTDTFERITSEGIQMHGGVGVTDEYDIGFYFKRARAAATLFGDAAWHKNRLATLKGY